MSHCQAIGTLSVRFFFVYYHKKSDACARIKMQTFIRWTECYGPREEEMADISSLPVQHLLIVVATMAVDSFSFLLFQVTVAGWCP